MDFIELAQRICNGKSQITKEESLAILNSTVGGEYMELL
jgi:hypothetical protein